MCLWHCILGLSERHKRCYLRTELKQKNVSIYWKSNLDQIHMLMTRSCFTYINKERQQTV